MRHIISNPLRLSFFVLVLAKIVVIYNFPLGQNLGDNLYIDVDRLIALILVIFFFFKKYQGPVKGWWLLSLLPLLTYIFYLAGLPPVKLIILFFMTALVEEIIFRVGILSYLTNFMTDKSAILFSSIIYTVVHIPFLSDPGYLIAVFILGLILGQMFLCLKRDFDLIIATLFCSFLHFCSIAAGLYLNVI